MPKADERARSLMSIPSIGPVTASAIAASMQEVSSFSGSRVLGLFWVDAKTELLGREERFGRVRYLRKLLVVGAHAVLYILEGHDDALRIGRAG